MASITCNRSHLTLYHLENTMFRLTYSPVVFVLMLAMSVATASAADPCCSSDSPHGLSVSLSGMPVLMDVTGGNGNTKSYTYCIALEGSSDEPPLNAEMTPGDPSWSITNAGGTSSRGSEGTDTYHARWGQTITVSGSKTITLEARALPFKLRRKRKMRTIMILKYRITTKASAARR